MNEVQRNKLAAFAHPQLKNNGSVTSAAIDTLGYDHARVIVDIGAVDVDLSALKVQECDTSGGTYADVSGTVFGTATNIAGSTSAIPTSGDDNKLWAIDIDLRGRKRYLKVVATVGNGSTGAYICVLCELSRAEESPDSASEAGFEEILRL